MATKLPFTGDFKVTCIYGQTGKLWAGGIHNGIDLVGITNKNVYSICNGIIEYAGFDKGGFGNYVRIKEDGTDNKIYLAHLEKIKVKVGQRVSPTTIVGIMGSTGNSTGAHTHVEIRVFNNGTMTKRLNPATYMGIPNKVGQYNSKDYQIQTQQPVNQPTEVIKKLARNTNLRAEPTTNSKGTVYLANTTVYVLESGVANANGYTWDKVKIKVTGKIGYMINKNYK